MNRSTIKILAIGNSFSVDSMEYLWQIFANAGYQTIVLGNLYIGGCTLATHAKNAKSQEKAYIYFKNTTGEWKETPNVSLMTGLLDEQWDIITMQQASGTSGVQDSYEPYLTDLIDFVLKHRLNPYAELVWNMTWAYEADSNHSEFINYQKDQLKMYQAIIDAVKTSVLSKQIFSKVIPVGTVIQNLRLLMHQPLTRDGFHLAIPHGRYAASLTWYMMLSGNEVENISYAPEGISQEEQAQIKFTISQVRQNPFVLTSVQK